MKSTKPKVVYIAHPISGAVKKNIKLVIEICRLYLTFEIIPLAPYLASLQYLNNKSSKDLAIGMGINKLYFQKRFVHELWLFGDRISKGMEQEIEWAFEYNIPVIAKTLKTRKALKQFIDKKRPKNSKKKI